MGKEDVKMNYKTRMLDELVYITKKIALLEKHIEKSECSSVMDEVLKRQLDAMKTYQECLVARLCKELEDKEQAITIQYQEKAIKEEPITYGVTM